MLKNLASMAVLLIPLFACFFEDFWLVVRVRLIISYRMVAGGTAVL